ncbi:3-methyl-2-oxobutanoate hydroxymethyltransferase [Pyrinomonas methylaliphatogenes]|jgi:3-methyl-2-oxobutanoate hydroxymethyltransferase|uniref:3-methyl-2-oxobutanoate hydroxymethyltransferase n=1 Tax=Pyrinomonas methylaliphatogenes TaxID=454194 RepID=A0A0B6WVI2_9BACT|nr:3-methyl-2-oxobutanoate hydroxymethyltransferase [Pyrinomonas methylaliphatogenes]MBX5479390.1 3-methyl-2-oxobutanoate hydroxymethyltransferase [Pyrinomonas methylaliphatogenes]CDM64299.1 ketopantoate hydroxymethyltransferase [Pyrinomonas methylaliphatogenes]
MAYFKQQRPEKVTVPSLRASKERGEKLVCLTAYDYPTARIIDEAGVEIVLVGDSLGNVVLGYENTIPVTLDEMVSATRAVRRGVTRALLVADMPYGSYHTGADDAVRAALRLIKEGGAEAVKLEGGRKRLQLIERLIAEEIPVMGHIGLTPQSVNQLGGFRLQGKTLEAARALIEDARALEAAGVFSIVLELVPREVARIITEAVKIPTIGIGAGPHCDIQVLVIHDLIGLSFTENRKPRFVRQYANMRQIMTEAISRFAEDVRSGSYPAEDESYAVSPETAAELELLLNEERIEDREQRTI